jgi:hypothetical protein
MRRPLWLLTVAAVVLMMVAAPDASAQTVFVRNAGSGATVELTLNGTPVAAGAPVSGTDAVFPLNIATTLNKPQTDVRLFVDSCGAVRRIFVEEAGRQPANGPGACLRRAISDLFVIQDVSSLVLDLAGDGATALIRQGPPPPEWLGLVTEAQRAWTVAPAGLVVSGGGGWGKFSQILSDYCGTATECSDEGRKAMLAASATFWFNRFVAADAGVVRPGHVAITGGGEHYQFTTDADIRLLTLGMRGGGQAGPFRISVVGGTAYTEATFTTIQITEASDRTASGNQTLAFKATGWGWWAAGSVEHWFSRWVAIYGEGGLIASKAENAASAEEGAFDDQMPYVTVGVRVHIGR